MGDSVQKNRREIWSQEALSTLRKAVEAQPGGDSDMDWAEVAQKLAQVRARSFRTVRLGFLATSRAPENTPRVPQKGTRGVLHRAILTEKCHLNPTQHPPTTRYAPGASSEATGALGDPNTPQNE